LERISATTQDVEIYEISGFWSKKPRGTKKWEGIQVDIVKVGVSDSIYVS